MEMEGGGLGGGGLNAQKRVCGMRNGRMEWGHVACHHMLFSVRYSSHISIVLGPILESGTRLHVEINSHWTAIEGDHHPSSCGYIIMWLYHHVVTSSCGYIIMWLYHHVDTSSCGYIIMWLHHHVVTSSCGYGYIIQWWTYCTVKCLTISPPPCTTPQVLQCPLHPLKLPPPPSNAK